MVMAEAATQQQPTSLKASEGLDNEVSESMNETKIVHHMSDEGNGTAVTESIVNGRNETMRETVDLAVRSDDDDDHDHDHDDHHDHHDHDHDHDAVEEHQAIDSKSLDEMLDATQVQSSEGMATAANEAIGLEKIEGVRNDSLTAPADDAALAFARNDDEGHGSDSFEKVTQS